jgi:two-component system, NtrC family, response regulator HydG
MTYRDSESTIVGSVAQGVSLGRTGKRVATAKMPHVDFIGNSPVIREIHSMIHLVSDSATPVLITGESGTGKDVVARLIHMKSPRADLPFIAINCAAVPRDVFENELFGHEHGAFTGATSMKPGYIEMADKGTLFLDELAEMDTDTQAKLLRMIETKTFRRLGGKSEMNADVRMLAATNIDVPHALETGGMRMDLYYRFSVIEIHLPPLRDRKEDIPLLIDHFLTVFCQKHRKPPKRFSTEAMKALLQYNWPGNIRELRNLVERIVILTPGVVVQADVLPIRVVDTQRSDNSITIPIGTTLDAAEKEIILGTLSSVNNNKSKAASMLGMSRKALYDKLKRYGAASEPQS